MEQDVAIRVVVQGQAPGSATVKVRALSAEQRGNRAFKAAAILAAIGMGSVFIPVVHFFLPWIMLISAVVVYTRIRGQSAVLLAATIQCPACNADVAIDEQPATWPIEWNCGGCRKRLHLDQAAPQ